MLEELPGYDSWRLAYPPEWDEERAATDPDDDDSDADDSDLERTPLHEEREFIDDAGGGPVGSRTEVIRGSDVMRALEEAAKHCFDTEDVHDPPAIPSDAGLDRAAG